MGQSHGMPNRTKSSEHGDRADVGVAWAVSSLQGWRDSMEDRHFAIGSLSYTGGWAKTALFGVLDGHGGAQVARFCESALPAEIAQGSCEDVPRSLVDAFHRMDDMLRSSWHLNAEGQGCAAVVCCVRRDCIVAANAGDCRAVMSRRGWAVDLSSDHKPDVAQERQRIENAGGYVATFPEGPSRVNGWLSLSRAIGDLQFKQDPSLRPEEQVVSATPDVRTFLRQPDDEFMILACDGVWDVRSSQEVVTFIRSRLDAGNGSKVHLTQIVEELLDSCVSPNLAETNGLGGDNMTAMLVVFDNEAISWSAKHVLGWLGWT
eukprot:TRINITY_DN91007_c0_g1_i1.p1 TRINITY_DN91007_c0_g1~~TRINITY_DN91007_c0_g1_i1.p1  ORF type:complete len:318 (-),score=63.73 TRINITY_DN91007_c0_g1_i1:181-1134(-)